MIIKGSKYSQFGTGHYEAGTADERISVEIQFIYLQGELVALMNGARSPPSLHQEWSDYRCLLFFFFYLPGVVVLFFSSDCRCSYNLEPITANMTGTCCHCKNYTNI